MNQRHAKNWDIFISYASEDKQDVARPLAHILDRRGLRVWFDEFGVQVGDSLTETIARGLAQSRYGVVIISHAFMEKKWPRNELTALFSLEGPERGLILPVWHNVQVSDVNKFNPLLADRYALNTHDGIKEIASNIIRKVGGWEIARDKGPIDGHWTGESGRLLLRTENDEILGNYDWYGERWIGFLQGRFEGNALRYEWSWTLDEKTGSGFFLDTIRNSRIGSMRCLSGAWWYNSDTVKDNDVIQYWKDYLHGGWLSYTPDHTILVPPGLKRYLSYTPSDSMKIHPWSFVVRSRF